MREKGLPDSNKPGALHDVDEGLAVDGREFNRQPAHRLHRVVSFLSLLLILYAAAYSWQSWREEKAAKVESLMNLMELEEQAIDAYLVHLQNSMRVLSQDLLGTSDAIDLDHAFKLVKRFKELHPELFNVSLIRDDGQILFTAKNPPGPHFPTLAQESSFLKFRKELREEQPFNIGLPFVGLINTEWIIPFRYQLRNQEGKLIYILNAGLPTGLLQKFWKDASITKKAALGLMRDDGFLVSRYPVPTSVQMDEIYGKPRSGALIKHLQQHQFPKSGYVEGPSSLDGPDFLNAFRRMEHFPVTLFIALPLSDVRAAWWDKVKVPYALSALLLSGAFMVYRLNLRRQQEREVEQWQANEVLRQSEGRYRAMFEKIGVVNLIIDPATGSIVDANPAACRFYGYTREQLRSLRIMEINILSEEQVKAQMELALSGRRDFFSFQHRLAGGEFRDVDVHCGPFEMEGRTVLFSIIIDVTERRRVEDALKSSEERFRMLVESAPDAIFVQSQGVFAYANPATVKLFGAETVDQLIGKSVFERVHPSHVELVRDQICAPGIEKEPSPSSEIQFLTLAGKTIDVESLGMPISYESRDGFLLFARDITERKRQQEDLRQKNAEMERFSYTISHDLKSPLVTIKTFLGFLEKDMERADTDRIKQDIAYIHSAADKMKELLDELLEFSRIGRVVNPSERLSFHALAKEALQRVAGQIADGRVEVRLSEADLTLYGDRLRLLEVWQNLFENALKYIGSPKEAAIEAGFEGSGRDTIFFVRDNGMGIEAQYHEKIFEMFEKLNPGSEGSGMGLALVKRIVGLYGGSIRVESQGVGHGSCFKFTLPEAVRTEP